MAFRTNKTPVLQTKSASGAVATFDTALAMPLVECKVSFMATQSGSGTPSPVNVRPITLVNSVNLSVNSVPVIVPLGDSYGGGVVDLLTGKAVISYVAELLDNNRQYVYQSTSDVRVLFTTQAANLIKTGDSGLLPLCDQTDTPPQGTGVEEWAIRTRYSGTPNRTIYIDVPLYENISTENELKAFFANNPFTVVYPLNTPIEVQFTPTQIETIIGNNTIFADTGDIDLTYKDLDIAKRGNFREVFKLPS